MSIVADHALAAAHDAPESGVALKLIGVTVAALVPALFWTAMMATFGGAIGAHFTISALALVGGAVALFLAAVCAPIMLRA